MLFLTSLNAIKSVGPLGTDDGTKTDEFWEKFQTAVDLPPSFSENPAANFFQFHPQIALLKGPKSAA